MKAQRIRAAAPDVLATKGSSFLPFSVGAYVFARMYLCVYVCEACIAMCFIRLTSPLLHSFCLSFLTRRDIGSTE